MKFNIDLCSKRLMVQSSRGTSCLHREHCSGGFMLFDGGKALATGALLAGEIASFQALGNAQESACRVIVDELLTAYFPDEQGEPVKVEAKIVRPTVPVGFAGRALSLLEDTAAVDELTEAVDELAEVIDDAVDEPEDADH